MLGPKKSDIIRFEEYINEVEWTYAKSMPHCPHEYTIRWKRSDLDEVFCSFAQFIRDFGYTQYYFSRPGKYFDIGPHKYFTMGSPIFDRNEVPKNKNTFVLNRADKTHRYGDMND